MNKIVVTNFERRSITIDYIRERFEYRRITPNVLEEIDSLRQEIENEIEATCEETKEQIDCLLLLRKLRSTIENKLG